MNVATLYNDKHVTKRRQNTAKRADGHSYRTGVCGTDSSDAPLSTIRLRIIPHDPIGDQRID
jgi:hypothetical protein